MRRHFLIKIFLILFFYIFTTQLLLAAAWNPTKVSFKTKDGVVLKALFEKPAAGQPVVILLHGLASSKEEWLPFAQFISKQSWGFLAYDARGHGASSKTKDMNGSPNGFQYFGKPGPGTEWERMIDDVGSAIAFIRVDQKLEDRPIVLCGASVGANVSLNYAALARPVKAVVLLSPGINFAGFGTEEPLKHVRGVPILLVAAQADQYSFESCERLSQLGVNVPFWTDVKPGHGVQMLDEALMKRLVDWIKQQK